MVRTLIDEKMNSDSPYTLAGKRLRVTTVIQAIVIHTALLTCVAGTQ